MANHSEDILEFNDCSCGCGCDEVELRGGHQPEVLLFDEYGELYECDIIYIREKVDEIENKIDAQQVDVTYIRGKVDSNGEKIEDNGEKLDELLERSAMYWQEATAKDVEQMFDGIMEDEDYMNLPSMDFDSDGYVALNISVDSDGYVHFEND